MSEIPRTLKEGWRNTREEMLQEAGNECWHCGVKESELQEKYGRGLSTHHLVPQRLFEKKAVADHPRNLLPLCTECHGLWEAETRRVLAGASRTRDCDAREAVIKQYTALLGTNPGDIHRNQISERAVVAIRRCVLL